MKFLINDKEYNESCVEPDLTLLRYLREHKSLKGTKEGCASGDCGACTVLVGSLKKGKLCYQTMNACITPLYAMERKHVVTIEYLSNKESMHPAQNAMIEKQGSQCGFCTPGFVMSFAALYEDVKQENKSISRNTVCESISGNLCRCTGYRPIIDAGLTMDIDAHSKLSDERNSIQKHLEKITQTQPKPAVNAIENCELSKKGFYVKPQNESELQAQMKENPHAKLIAGGTDFMLEVTQAYKDFNQLIDISEVSELTTISSTSDSIHIGASVSYSQLQDYFSPKYKEFTQLIERIASQQIRNRGTIGGNIANASPIADLPPILLAFDTEVVIKTSQGLSRNTPLNLFYKAYKTTQLKDNEYIAKFIFPKIYLNDPCYFFKVSKRIEDDISSVMLATRFEIDGKKIKSARIAYGGMAATPLRVSAAEKLLSNKNINDLKAIEKAIEVIKSTLSPLSDVRASAEYRLDIACNLLRKSWMQLNDKAVPCLTHSEYDVSQFEQGQVKTETAPHA